MKKRLFIGILACLLLLSSCGENAQTPTDVPSVPSDVPSETGKTRESFRLPYNADSRLNPFVTDSMLNLAAAWLVAEPLMLPNVDGTAAPVLASSVTPSEDFLTYTVTLRDDVLFSDGTPLTVSDVLASADRARTGTFASCLNNVTAVTAAGENALAFSLVSPDPSFAAMLSFPVLKEGTAVETFIGTGAFAFSGTEGTLTRNPHYREQVRSERIELIAVEHAAALHAMLSADQIDAYYTEHPAKTSGSFSASECKTSTRGFLAFRTADGLCADETFRSLLVQTIDTARLIADAEIFAEPVERQPSDGTLEAYLISLGYTSVDTEGYRVKTLNRKTVPAELTLACLQNESSVTAANAIAEQLQAVGLRVLVTPCETWQTASFDLFFGEITLLPNGDVSELYALTETDPISEDPLPAAFLYNCKGKLLYSRNFAEGVGTDAFCPYKNVQNWLLYE